MAAEIKLTKTDESPWGFRLTGGRDFGTPLTIIKVQIHSVAEDAGLQVGDILVKINDTDCHPLTHKEAQEIILQSNNTVSFSVLRGSLSLSEDVIDRLTPLPLRDFRTPEPTAQNRSEPIAPNENQQVAEPTIEVIPIQDLEPELLEELGLNPLPEDFLEKAKRDPSPMPEVRPQSRMASPIDVLEALEELGLKDVVQDIERQKEQVFVPPPAAVQQQQQEIPQEVTGESAPTSGEVNAAVSAEDNTAASGEVEVTSPIAGNDAKVASSIPPADQEPIVNAGESHVQPITDEEFAEFISGQEEVLEVEGKNALGVDFSKYEPKADFLRKSQVFKTLQDNEHVITKEEKDRRWTTFLDKPKGPKPKPRPKPQPQFATLEPQPAPATDSEPAGPETRKGLYEIPPEEEFEALVRVPTPPPPAEPAPETEPVVEQEPNAQPEEEKEDVKQQLEEEQQNLQQQLELEKQLNPEKFGDGEEKSEIEIQLEEIQRQLQAIQQLPFEIQQHLALVQQQLNQIVQHRLQKEVVPQEEEPSSVQEEGSEIPSCPRPSMVDPSLVLENIEEIEKHQELSTLEEVEEQQPQQEQQPEPAAEQVTETCEEPKQEFKLRTEEDPPILPPPKKERPRKKRPFLGLGPAPRPLILPGGRKWRTPKDAYNDEFIAETLSAQAEIITGTTLGVNFKRYEPKPPNLVHLRDSTVYKMIHDLEDPDVVNKGLASRPEIVPAIQDFAQQSAPAAI